MIREIVRQYADPGSRIVEIGCGYGANLFGLLDEDRWAGLTGLDVSANALQAGRLIAQHFGVSSQLAFEPLDLLEDRAPGWASLEGAFVLSYYSFEQITSHTASVVERIHASNPSRVLHVEPTPELWSLHDPKDAISRAYAWSQNYQDNLLETLQSFERRGAVRIRDLGRLYYAPTVRHDPTLICWEIAR
jgi:SAM-dependent methyltransferase